MYNDIQTDIKDALDNDLSDVVSDFVFKVYGQAVYNPATGTSVTPETLINVRGVIITDIQGEIADLPNTRDGVKLLIMNDDTTIAFEVDNEVLVDGINYKLSGVKKEPGSISWLLDCRKV